MPRSLSEEDPCPGRIVADAGGAFAVGAVGGSVFHFIKGVRDSPSGARFTGGAQALRMNAPRVGGSFAVWGGLFSAFNCAAAYARQKDDPWNSIAAGAAAAGLLSVRQGLRAAAKSAASGAALLALVEGMGILANRAQAAQAQRNRPQVHNPTLAAAIAAQRNLPQVDDPILSAAVTNRVVVHDPDLVDAEANRLHDADQNLPPVDDPAIAAQ
ncbi:mitochondrial import inner membrane translocase subunit TIM17-1-like [Lolium perenne]|uniref:mitochondrial import inner membrane translocase subunit TIM17-1-like n=1 Tax=Lolium perenne TaxID=4522 RepID=UPI0021F68C8C|nr:mitochondrial import inner membrane translocase subunit TIM17-1-like [Lolium perenne]